MTTGRRPGPSTSRQAILDAAREQFAAKGYRAATMRTIAAAAGVDTALIRHFFGTKDTLFAASLDVPRESTERIVAALSSAAPGIGQRFARTYLELWEDPTSGQPLQAMVRSAIADPEAAELLRGYLRTNVVDVITPGMEVDQPAFRVGLAASHLLGAAIGRHVVAIEPLASTDFEVLVNTVAPLIEHYLLGDLHQSATDETPPSAVRAAGER